MDLESFPLSNAAGSQTLRAPLLVWLLSRDIHEASNLVRQMLHNKLMIPHAFDAWCMMDLVAMCGKSKVYMMTPQRDATGLRRADMDALASVQLEREFLHYLFSRTKVEGGFKAEDVVILMGNMMLPRIDRFQGSFVVRLLNVDGSDTGGLAAKLCTPIDVLTINSPEALVLWLEKAVNGHRERVCNISSGPSASSVQNDPWFDLSRQSHRELASAHKLRGLTWEEDGLAIQASMCKIQPLRSVQNEVKSDSDSDGGSVDEAGNPKVKKTRPTKKAKVTLTSTMLKQWVDQKLVENSASTLKWTVLKKAIVEHFQQKVENSLMESSGLRSFATNGRYLVKNESGNRLDWHPSL